MNKGFTLVELLLYMALMTIFFGVLTNLFVATLDVKKESEATSAVEMDGKYILTRFGYDINRASAIGTPGTLGQTTSNMVLTIGGVTQTYALSSGNLTLTVNGQTANLNGSETTISGLSFQRLGNSGGEPDIQIKFTATSTTKRPKGPEVRNYQTTVGLR
jgi:type II secretory pathway pseudopilin PulG